MILYESIINKAINFAKNNKGKLIAGAAGLAALGGAAYYANEHSNSGNNTPKTTQQDISASKPAQQDISASKPAQQDISASKPAQQDNSASKPAQQDISAQVQTSQMIKNDNITQDNSTSSTPQQNNSAPKPVSQDNQIENAVKKYGSPTAAISNLAAKANDWTTPPTERMALHREVAAIMNKYKG